MNLSVLQKYKRLLGKRYYSLLYIFEELLPRHGMVVAELGTSRSFVSGGNEGCMSCELKYWSENQVNQWDWGAGLFTRVFAKIIHDTDNILHTVDPSITAKYISKIITAPYSKNITHNVTTFTEFIQNFIGQIDLIYMDHHETCEEGALLHLQDAKLALNLNILTKSAVILIDDVHTHEQGNETGADVPELGKGKYSIPFLKSEGYEVVYEGYQVVMRKNTPDKH